MEKKYPTFSICNLVSNKLSKDLFNADKFEGYLINNPPIKNIHKHSFYHLVYFTKGKGVHTIDFTNYAIEAGCIYFMIPGQVHHWKFEEDEVEGYVINFSDIFFDNQQPDGSYVKKDTGYQKPSNNGGDNTILIVVILIVGAGIIGALITNQGKTGNNQDNAE